MRVRKLEIGIRVIPARSADLAPSTGEGILVLVSPAAPDKTVLPAAEGLASMLRDDGLEVNMSQSFVGPFPPVDDRLKVIVYVK